MPRDLRSLGPLTPFVGEPLRVFSSPPSSGESFVVLSVGRIGEGGIRTPGSVTYTCFPSKHLKPLGHLSNLSPEGPENLSTFERKRVASTEKVYGPRGATLQGESKQPSAFGQRSSVAALLHRTRSPQSGATPVGDSGLVESRASAEGRAIDRNRLERPRWIFWHVK
jgi:hypothetical protein